MVFSNLHTHTVFSDGKNTPEEMVARAKELGFSSLGFSDHSTTPFDLSYCMPGESLAPYLKTLRQLQASEELPVFCSIEKDAFSVIDPEEYDYVIGSVHYVPFEGGYVSVDSSPRYQEELIRKSGGDPLELARRYYDTVVRHAQSGGYAVQGHFDLVNKYGLFDDASPAYRRLATEALEEVMRHVPFLEINTGAIARGYRTEPYPARFLLEEMKALGARLILNSDAHSTAFLDCHFRESLSLLKSVGVESLWQFDGKNFFEVSLGENG